MTNGHRVSRAATPSFRRPARLTVLALSAALTCGADVAAPEGSRTGVLELSDIAAGHGGFIVDGTQARNARGRVTLGDVNGDGLDDFLVLDNETELPSVAYVVFGKTDTAPVALSAIAAGLGGGFVINGDSNFVYVSVSPAGDMNGDGLTDIALCDSPYYDSACFVVYGKSDVAPVDLSNIGHGHGGFLIEPDPDVHPRFFNGRNVALAGDVNGDGLPDLIIGEPTFSPDKRTAAGRAFVVFGQTGGSTVHLTQIAEGRGDGFVIDGALDLSQAGSSVAGAGDVNGDGLGDLVIGAPADEHYGDSHGHVYVVFGKTDNAPVDLANFTNGFVVNGADYEDQAGDAVGSAGDVNGDGLADLFVGAGGYFGGGAGKSYIVFGKQDDAPVQLSNLDSGLGGGYAIVGKQRRSYCGDAVASVDDINGDGLSDLLIGCADDDFKGGEGQSYVIYGKTDPDVVERSSVADGGHGLVVRGEKGYARRYSGLVVSSAGDINGDGLPDLMVTDLQLTYIVFASTSGAFSKGTHVDQLGTSADERFIGTPARQTLVGGGGDDVFVGHGREDVLAAGSGSDTFMLDASNVKTLERPLGQLPGKPRVARVEGGAGRNSIVLLGTGLDLDLSSVPRPGTGAAGSHSRIDSIQRIDLGRRGANQMHIEVADVHALTGMNLIHHGNGFKQGWRDGSYAFPKFVRRHQLVVEGAAGDTIVTTPGTWQFAGTVTHNGDGHEYAVYESVAGHAQLIIDGQLQRVGFP